MAFPILWSVSSPWIWFPLLCGSFLIACHFSLSIFVIIFCVGDILLENPCMCHCLSSIVLPVFSYISLNIQAFDSFQINYCIVPEAGFLSCSAIYRNPVSPALFVKEDLVFSKGFFFFLHLCSKLGSYRHLNSF